MKFIVPLQVTLTPLTTLVAMVREQAVPLACAAGALVGCGVWFGLPFNPPWWLPLGPAVLGLVSLLLTTFYSWRWPKEWCMWLCLSMAVFMGWSAITTHQLSAQFRWQAASSKSHWLVGQVAEMTPSVPTGGPPRVRVVVEHPVLYQLPGSGGIRRVTLSVLQSQFQAAGLQTGAWLAAPVILFPPEAPFGPYVRDSRLWRWADRETVYGYVQGEVAQTQSPIQAPQAVLSLLWPHVQAKVNQWRHSIAASTQSMGQGVLPALLVGDQASITPALRQAYQAAGLSHLLAISGFQMALAGVGVFWLLRWVLAWWPWLAVRVNVKIPAAVGGLVATAAYAMLAGGGVSVLRAFITVGVVLLAFIIGRTRQLLRSWAVAVVVLLAVNPLWIHSAAFSLSLAAVLGLVLWGAVLPALPAGAWRRGGAMLQRATASSVVAGAATAPLVALWFGQFSLVAVLGNVVAIPLMALGTYVGLVALAVWPLGVEALPLALLAWLVEVCNTWAVWLSQTPQALVWLPSWGWAALVLPCLGTLCAMLMQRGWLAVVGLACSALVAVGIAVPAPKQMLLGGSQPIPQRLQMSTQQWGDAWLTLTPAGTYAIQVVHDPRSLQAYVSRTVLPLAQPVSAKLAKPFPIATPQPFLYATQFGVQPWQVVPLACQRPWQRVAQACWP